MSKLKKPLSASALEKIKKRDRDPSSQPMAGRGTRETIESIVIAVILAFLFRAFEAEAFVIPTGSMAPTLQGRHVDLECPKCKYWYREGASKSDPYAAICPICRYPADLLGDEVKGNTAPVTGDRILVSKFAYQAGNEPSRWDVIVFKYPGNGKQNFIKRLIGLPGERIRIWRGNIYVKKDGDDQFRIARKTEAGPAKLKAMLQLIDDTNHIPPDLTAVNWPLRWQEWSSDGSKQIWRNGDDGKKYFTDGSGQSWLRYHHLIPSIPAWDAIKRGDPVVFGNPADPEIPDWPGMLIGDFYAYNGLDRDSEFWVGDLAFECDVNVTSESGELLLKLVRAGIDYDCRIDIATGQAKLSIDGGYEQFSDDAGNTFDNPTAMYTGIQGPGRYHIRFANVDDELVLWVNDSPVEFDQPTTYLSEISAYVLPEFVGALPDGLGRPRVSAADPGDKAPAGIGTSGASLEVSSLRMFRDVYYVCANNESGLAKMSEGRKVSIDIADANGNVIKQVLLKDGLSEDTKPLDFPVKRPLGEGQYFPMGDNSPQSSDARLWRSGENPEEAGYIPPYVERKYLIGKAVFIYWPHPWYGFLPNFGRMGFIR